MFRDVEKQHPISLRRNSLAVVAAIFVVTFAAFEAVIFVAFDSGRLDWLMELTAQVTYRLAAWMGWTVSLSGKQLIMSNHILQIDLECTAITIAALYTALVIAYPLSARTRFFALPVGLPAIGVANLLRLFGVALASEYLSASVFLFVHDYLFKVLMMLVVVALWAVWLQMARTHAAKA